MKTNRLIVYFACLLAVFLAAISLKPASALSTNPEIADLQSRVTALEKRVNTLESALKVTAGSVSIVSPGSITVQASGSLSLKGSLIKLNDNGRPLARVGDQVLTGNSVGTITSGSPTVLAN